MLITTGAGIGRRRFRSAEPSSHASFVVKCSKTKEASMRAIDSSFETQGVSLFHSNLIATSELTSFGGGWIGFGIVGIDLDDISAR
jgi:hypothetical protein